MNTHTKLLTVICLMLAAFAWGEWTKAKPDELATVRVSFPVSVATSADGKIVYVGKNGQLWRSTDGGETWSLLK